MDSRTKDPYGSTICPNCLKHYIPKLPEPNKDDRRCIQDIYPQATKIQWEQLITGICCDECWDEYLGVKPEDDEEE